MNATLSQPQTMPTLKVLEKAQELGVIRPDANINLISTELKSDVLRLMKEKHGIHASDVEGLPMM